MFANFVVTLHFWLLQTRRTESQVLTACWCNSVFCFSTNFIIASPYPTKLTTSWTPWKPSSLRNPVFECIRIIYITGPNMKKSDAVQVNKGCLLFKNSLSGKPFYKKVGSEWQSDLKHPPVFCVIRNSFSTSFFLCLFSVWLFCLNAAWIVHLSGSSDTF